MTINHSTIKTAAETKDDRNQGRLESVSSLSCCHDRRRQIFKFSFLHKFNEFCCDSTKIRFRQKKNLIFRHDFEFWTRKSTVRQKSRRFLQNRDATLLGAAHRTEHSEINFHVRLHENKIIWREQTFLRQRQTDSSIAMKSSALVTVKSFSFEPIKKSIRDRSEASDWLRVMSINPSEDRLTGSSARKSFRR